MFSIKINIRGKSIAIVNQSLRKKYNLTLNGFVYSLKNIIINNNGTY